MIKILSMHLLVGYIQPVATKSGDGNGLTDPRRKKLSVDATCMYIEAYTRSGVHATFHP
jgi:hypothetical protein